MGEARKAEVMEMIRKEMEKNNEANKNGEFSNYAHMSNYTKFEAKNLIVHGEPCQWSGGMLKPYSDVPNRGMIRCYYKRTSPEDGVVGGVAFADGTDSTAHKWVLAFDFKNSKVYAEAGPIGPIDWNVMKVKLDDPKTTNGSWYKFLSVEIAAFIDPRNNHLGVMFLDYVDDLKST